VLTGDADDQVAEAVALLHERGALTASVGRGGSGAIPAAQQAELASTDASSTRVVAVVIEAGRANVGAELVGAASRLAGAVGARVHALAFAGDDLVSLGAVGADEVTHFVGSTVAEDAAAAALEWAAKRPLWAVLGPGTAFGREVLGRMAARLGAGLVGDAIGLEVVDGELIAAKPAFSGALVADISCTSAIRMASVRPGVLPLPARRVHVPEITTRSRIPRGRVRVVSERRDDDIEVLARAEVVIGVGSAVHPDQYELLSPLAALLGAELAATRKVTDKGWAPRSRQVGITGRSIAPRLYVALGLSGKFNHVVGVRGAGTILAINNDPEALVFGHCDVGIVGDWRVVVPNLVSALRPEQDRQPASREGVE
jgi:electron transfer flavoprotein alpha subunit